MTERPLSYILDGHTPVAVTIEEWLEWRKRTDDRHADANGYKDPDKWPNRVAWSEVGGYNVSTVFLAFDHGFSFGNDHVPILFETMACGEGPWDEYQDRYATWEQAEAGHAD